MKRSIVYILCLLTISLGGCFKEYEERYLFEDNRLEFEDAVTTSNTSGKAFPILGPMPATEGKVVFRVNMTGKQASHDRVVKFRIVPEETTAIEGRDFALAQGREFTIPANSSFGYIEVELLQDGSGSPTIVLELLPTGDIKVMNRYHRIGLRFVYDVTKPDLSKIEEINDIKRYNGFLIGAHQNQNTGHFLDLHTFNLYNRAGAEGNSTNIDFGLMNGATSGLNLITPNSTRWGAFTGWTIPATFPHVNSGTILRISQPETVDLNRFTNATSTQELLAAYSYFSATIASRPGYSSTNDGPGDHIRQIVPGDLIVYYSLERETVAIMHVQETIPTNTGEMVVNIKTGQFNPEDILVARSLTIETASGTTSRGYVDLATVSTYGLVDATTFEQRTATDFGYIWSTASGTNYGNFLPMKASFSGWSSVNNVLTAAPPDGWTTDERNSGTFIHLDNPTPAELEEVAIIMTREDLVTAYEQALVTHVNRPGYDATTSAGTMNARARRMAPGSIIFFKSDNPDRDLYAVMVVQSLSTSSSTNRRMELLIKSDLN